MKDLTKCLQCGSTDTHHGKLLASAGLYFRPDDTKTMILRDVAVTGRMCAACGFIELFGDSHVLQQNLKPRAT